MGDAPLDQAIVPALAATGRCGRRAVAGGDRSIDAGWQRDLSVSHNKVGDVLQAHGDLAGPLAAYQESLAVRQRWRRPIRSIAGWQRDLSVSQNKVGDVLGATAI